MKKYKDCKIVLLNNSVDYFYCISKLGNIPVRDLIHETVKGTKTGYFKYETDSAVLIYPDKKYEVISKKKAKWLSWLFGINILTYAEYNKLKSIVGLTISTEKDLQEIEKLLNL